MTSTSIVELKEVVVNVSAITTEDTMHTDLRADNAMPNSFLRRDTIPPTVEHSIFERKGGIPSLQDQLFVDGLNFEKPQAFTESGRELDSKTGVLKSDELMHYLLDLADNLWCSCENEAISTARAGEGGCCLVLRGIRDRISTAKSFECLCQGQKYWREMNVLEAVRVVEYLESPARKLRDNPSLHYVRCYEDVRY